MEFSCWYIVDVDSARTRQAHQAKLNKSNDWLNLVPVQQNILLHIMKLSFLCRRIWRLQQQRAECQPETTDRWSLQTCRCILSARSFCIQWLNFWTFDRLLHLVTMTGRPVQTRIHCTWVWRSQGQWRGGKKQCRWRYCRQIRTNWLDFQGFWSSLFFWSYSFFLLSVA